MQRVIFISDIHGCLDELCQLLKKVSYSNSDRVILLGDLIDRGPNSIGVIEKAMECNFESVLGNHEDKYLVYSKDTNSVKNMSNHKKQIFSEMKEKHLSWMQSLPDFIKVGNLVALHGGCLPNIAIENQAHNEIIRIRYVDENNKFTKHGKFWATKWTGPESIVYGHYVHKGLSIRIDEHNGYSCYGIDTGCCFGGSLTAMIVDNNTKSFVSVQAKREYVKLIK